MNGFSLRLKRRLLGSATVNMRPDGYDVLSMVVPAGGTGAVSKPEGLTVGTGNELRRRHPSGGATLVLPAVRMSPSRLWHVWRLHSNEPLGSLLVLCDVRAWLEQIAQARPRAIVRLDGAITVLLVEILAAPGADSAAVLSADGSYRHVH